MARVKDKWHLFLISTIVSSGLTIILVNANCLPKEHEKISVFATAYSINKSGLNNKIKEATSDEIREVAVRNGTLGDNEAYYMFEAYYDLVDFYILPYSWLDKVNTIASHFDAEIINSVIPNSIGLDLVSDEVNNYAIKIYDKTTNEGFLKEYFTFEVENKEEEDYYIVFRDGSIHLGELNNSKSNNVVNVVNHLLEL